MGLLVVNSCRALIVTFLCKWRARVGLGAHKAPGRHATHKPPDREGGLFLIFCVIVGRGMLMLLVVPHLTSTHPG